MFEIDESLNLFNINNFLENIIEEDDNYIHFMNIIFAMSNNRK